jgi:DNA-binding response OmpR family regulator
MSCARCEALARENAELREELGAWRGQDDDDRRSEALVDRIARLRRVLPVEVHHGSGTAKLLLALIDRPGQLVGRERLLRIVARDADNPPESKIVDVYVCNARKALRLSGFPEAIETIWGGGFRLAPDVARELRARMGETA